MKISNVSSVSCIRKITDFKKTKYMKHIAVR